MLVGIFMNQLYYQELTLIKYHENKYKIPNIPIYFR